jgi:hypothetical protein
MLSLWKNDSILSKANKTKLIFVRRNIVGKDYKANEVIGSKEMEERLNEHYDMEFLGLPFPSENTTDLNITHNLKLSDCTLEY